MMTAEEARGKAEKKVFVYMYREDIESECRARGIKVTKNRDKMELALIEAYTKEWTEKEPDPVDPLIVKREREWGVPQLRGR